MPWVLEGKRTTIKKILAIPIFIGGFIFGIAIPVLFFSAGVFAATSYFMQTASHPWVYIILGGLFCFWVAIPNGERNVLGVLTSVIFYMLFMTLPQAMGHGIISTGKVAPKWALIILLAFFLFDLITYFCVWLVIKLERCNNS